MSHVIFLRRRYIQQFFVGKSVSLLFCNYQNKTLELERAKGLFVESHVHEILALFSILMLTTNSDVMINLFGSPLLYQLIEIHARKSIESNLDRESIFGKTIKVAIKNSCKDVTKWFLEQLANEEILIVNAGYTVLGCLKTLPTSSIRKDQRNNSSQIISTES
ncbi:2818_t:CDS:1 [Acaulospora morrowiae]|uniref:2818_t:CDS:1 n=1 Tax=Acaulospora morrowiae TaxID=94023 RepID=A0A9N9EUJ6_9GLOM|nr:2818_t:CDS:1 [Acaulospora morrowiae]